MEEDIPLLVPFCMKQWVCKGGGGGGGGGGRRSRKEGMEEREGGRREGVTREERVGREDEK